MSFDSALTTETLTGPWAGLPVAWTADDEFDEATYRADVARCCRAGIPGVYTGGTTGEFYAMEFDEFQRIARATIEECHAYGTPAMIGCTSTYTLGVVRRARYAAELGADAIQVALPFWIEIGDEQIVPFFREAAAAAGGVPLSIYETRRAKRTLTLDQHRAIRDAVPDYLMVKANAGTVGATPEGCSALSQIVNVFVGEDQWLQLGSAGIRGSCSSLVYWNPRIILRQWSRIAAGDWTGARPMDAAIVAVHQFLHNQFGARGFSDTAYDRLGGIASGFLKMSLHSRGPYVSPTSDDVDVLRQWYYAHLPEMLELEEESAVSA